MSSLSCPAICKMKLFNAKEVIIHKSKSKMHELDRNENWQNGTDGKYILHHPIHAFYFWMMQYIASMDRCPLDIYIFSFYFLANDIFSFNWQLVFFCMHHQYSWCGIYKVLFYKKRQGFWSIINKLCTYQRSTDNYRWWKTRKNKATVTINTDRCVYRSKLIKFGVCFN